MKLVVLTGIPGSGSTTLLKRALEEVDYVHLNYGDIMTEIAIKENIVEDRDSLRKLPAETQKEIQAKAAKEINWVATRTIVDACKDSWRWEKYFFEHKDK